MVLFTHLKMILLQCFQFSIFSFSKNKLYPNGPNMIKIVQKKKEGSHKTIVQDKLDIMNDEDKKKGMVRKSIVKEMLESIERHQSNSKSISSRIIKFLYCLENEQ